MQTIDAVWAKLVAKRLDRQGLSAAELLQRAEIKPYLVAKATENGCFGLDLAANEGDPRDNGLLVYTALSSKTLGEALKVVERYFHVFNEAIDVNVEFWPREVTVEYHLSDAGLAAPRQAMEFGAANLVRSLRFLTNSRLRPGEVKFRHSRNHDIAKFVRFFGCPVHFGTRHNSLTFSGRQLALPIATADKRLHGLLIGYCEEILVSREDSSPDLRHRVEKIIAKRLCKGEAETEAVAHELGMSIRTLARRLGELGVTFAQISDELRHDLASRYLRAPI
jgi:hypothetical protein